MKELLLGLVALGFGILFCRPSLSRKAFALVLLKHSFDSPTLDEVQVALTEVNLNSTNHAFSARSRANIHFRGRAVTIVNGEIGSVAAVRFGVRWQMTEALFAIMKRSRIGGRSITRILDGCGMLGKKAGDLVGQYVRNHPTLRLKLGIQSLQFQMRARRFLRPWPCASHPR